jgi:hypothetical protein
MKNIFIVITVTLVFFTLQSNAQVFEIINDKAFGTIGRESYPSLISINDHELILACRTDADIDGDKTDPICDDIIQPIRSDIWLVKMDTAFNIIWNKSIGGAYTESEPTLEYDSKTNHILISCTSISDSSCEKTSNSWFNSPDIWLIEIDTSGALIKDQRFGGFNDESRPGQLIDSKNQHLIWGASKSQIGGDKNSSNHSTQTDIWVIKTDSLGNKIWDKSFGGTGSEFQLSTDQINYSKSVLIDTSENFFYLIGSTNSPIGGDITQPPNSALSPNQSNALIVKIDSSGNKLWDKRYCGIMKPFINSILTTNDDLLLGTVGVSGFDMADTNKANNSENVWILKTDSTGNKIWDHFYGGSGTPVNGIGASERGTSKIENALDGGYLVTCTTNNDIGFDISEPTFGGMDYWLFKIDVNGNKIWDKRFGGSKNDYCAGFVQMPDSSIYIYGMSDAGGVTSIKTDSGHFYQDIWIVHFKYHDTTTVTNVASLLAFEQGIKLFPNPASNFCTVQSANERINSVQVYNTVGELLNEIKSPAASSIQLPLENYSPGFYLITIKSNNHHVTKKLIIGN